MTSTIQVRFRLFANLRDAASCELVTVEVPHRSTVASAFAVAADRHPELGDWQGRVVFARNACILRGDAVVNAGDELDALPPVSGG